MTFDEAKEALRALQGRGWRLGLDRMHELCRRLGVPHGGDRRFVHIAGTNGKGSTTRFTQAILTAHGLKTGSCFSPYVYDVRERVQVDGLLISKDDFANVADRVLAAGVELESTPFGETTEFEAKTAMAFLHWSDTQCDAAVVETGLGGRLDATNIVEPEVSVITSIGLDHTAILGDTLEAIAAEKAGIIKPGKPCIVGNLPDKASSVIERVCQEKGSPCWMWGRDIDVQVAADSWTWHFGEQSLTLPYPEGLVGPYQIHNAALALTAASVITPLGPAICTEVVRTTTLPGRFERRVVNGQTWILDGAHNQDAITALVVTLQQSLTGQKFNVILGMLEGHDAAPVMQLLSPYTSQMVTVPINWTRTQSPEDLAETARQPGIKATACWSVDEAVGKLQQEKLPVLVTGSFYLLGEVAEALVNA